MKIKTTYDVYCYRYSNGEYKYSQVNTNYQLIDNDVKIDLGDLSFEEDRNDWRFGKETKGIVREIYDQWLEFGIYYEENKINQLKEEINNDTKDILEGILEELNNKTIELKDYINNDLDKLKSLLILLIDEFEDKHPQEIYCNNKPIETIYDEEYKRIY